MSEQPEEQVMTCSRCAVWRGFKDASFVGATDAADHLVTAHPGRAVKLLLKVGPDEIMKALHSKEHLG